MNWGNLSSGLLGGVIGALIGAFAAWQIERAQWAKDCRKQEWRQLLDSVAELQSAIVAEGYQLSDEKADRVSNAWEALKSAVNDRLFICEKKLEQIRAAVEPVLQNSRASKVPEMLKRCETVRELVIATAHRDLGIAGHAERKATDRTDAAASGR